MASDKNLREEALALPLEKRAALAHELLESLDEQESDPTAVDVIGAALATEQNPTRRGVAAPAV